MSKSAKEVVADFYGTDAYRNPDEMKNFLHPDVQLLWNSSTGFTKLDFDGILDLARAAAQSYDSLRAQVSHLLQDGDYITARYTYFVSTIENPDEEMALAHFITIWQVKDGKLYKGYEVSQLADDTPVNMQSFDATKL